MSERLFLRLEGDATHGPESTAPAGTLRAGVVPRALRAHLSGVLLYREQLGPGEEILERVLPDGAVRLVFNLGDAPSAGEGPGHAVEVIGAAAAPALVRLQGRMDGVSVALRPGAASALLGVPASELTGTAVHLDDLWAGEGTRLLERVAAAPGDAARITLVTAALSQRLRRLEPVHERSRHAADLIAASAGSLPVRAIAEAVGVGERRLQQLFEEHVGLTPRVFRRLSRLHACLRALRREPRPAWAKLALDAGYYDQAHLVNEFRALSGLSPTAFLEQAASGSSKTVP